MGGWDFWIDRGGTFTDVVARDPAGALHLRKLLSENPERYEDAPLQAIAELLGREVGELRGAPIRSVKMGTTVATNALLERSGEPVTLITTAGFGDALEIGSQARPEIFALDIRKPESLVRAVIEASERISAEGEVLIPIDLRALRPALEAAIAGGARSFAVAFLHGYAHPQHEMAVGALLAELGAEQVSLSHEVAPEIKLVARGDTTVVDAALTPILRRYVARIRAALGEDVSLRFMQSHGGLVDAGRFTGKDAILSGPAGGVVACAEVAKQTGCEAVIGFDMGGTSTDVSRYGGELERVYETVTAGVRIQAPMLHIETVAAGGGSRLRFEDGRFKVGPDSAGANPGPTCYRRGGPLAVTDANAILGRIQPRLFPSCFGPGADEPLDLAASRRRFAELAEAVSAQTGEAWSIERVAAGFRRVANDNMVKPIQAISVARGYDVREHALLCFGGAGGQHACEVAAALGMRKVILHPYAGVLSAFGMGLADLIDARSRPWLERLGADGLAAELDEPRALAAFEALEVEGRQAILSQGIPAEGCATRRVVELRYEGVEDSLAVELGPELRARFEAAHERLFGFVKAAHPIQVVNLRLEATGRMDRPELPEHPLRERDLDGAEAPKVEVWFEGPEGLRAVATPVFERADLAPGDALSGPALLTEAAGTTVVDPGWRARVDGRGILILEAAAREDGPARLSTARDPVSLEVFNNLFMSIAERMGVTLRRVSHSTNIKERLDFSCALFDGAGQLIANAPHIPVHLGAMGESVKAILARCRAEMAPGDVYVTNDPFHGGSHLPDVTVVTPVFEGPDILFFVANRGHHADIGGATPGSMPPFSSRIEEEGIRLHGLRVVRAGRFDEDAVRAALGAGPHPARDMGERLSDLRAQVAANAAGARMLGELCERVGLEVVQAYMGHVQDNAEEAMRAVLREMPDGEASFFDHLDEGARIAVTIRVEGDEAEVDFSGTDAPVRGNLNAPRAVVRAAVLYVFRTLISRPIPLNAGGLAPLRIRIPEGTLLSPAPPAAVVGGNVETSQRIVDVLYGALGRLAAAQGTMNNLTFGDDSFGVYETICGGAGAGLGFDGASAVHTHMTNTRITDPEVLERRAPVRVEAFAIRRGSGGDGVWRGGDGVVRELRFLKPLTASILSERRACAPFGLHGGGAGQRGRNALIRGARVHELPGKVRLDIAAGDRLRIETPGGGGYAPSPAEWAAMSPAQARRLIREGRATGPTSGIAAGRQQANLVILPASHADAFEAYCRANPQPCPLLERTAPGETGLRRLAEGVDLRVDLPRYRVFEGGRAREVTDLRGCWPEDGVAFLLGCSFSFEDALLRAGIGLRHIALGRNVAMYRTRLQTRPAGPFAGPLVVSMRPIPESRVAEAAALTAPFASAHGAPLREDAAALGIASVGAPDFGDAVPVEAGERPVFWACGVTSQVALEAALASGALPWAITHAPGHMLICDVEAGPELGLWEEGPCAAS